jgi:phosphatidate cytidylyltransferase
MPAASAGSVSALPDPDQRGTRRVRWGDLPKRAVSAAVLAPLALICLWLGDGWWSGLLMAAALGMAVEWVQLCGGRLASPAGAAVLLVILGCCVAALLGWAAAALGVIAGGFLLVWLAGSGASLAAGVPYLGLPLVALTWLRGDGAAGRDSILFLLLVVWASDIGAYAVGRLVGGPKLAPRVSPSKTWAGAAGGLAAGMAVGTAAALALDGGSASPRILAVAGGIAVVAQLGDLAESALKRHYGVKDSGRLIPGHGGLLDRLDGVLAAAPVAGLLAVLLGRGVVLWR